MQRQGYVWAGSGEMLAGEGSMTDTGIPGFVQNTGMFGQKKSGVSDVEFEIAMERGNVPPEVREMVKKGLFSNGADVSDIDEELKKLNFSEKERKEIIENLGKAPISPTTGKDGAMYIWTTQPEYLSRNDKHAGIDASAGEGSPSYSIIDGKIEEIYDSKEKAGKKVNSVTVKDKDGNLVTQKHITPDPKWKKGMDVYAGDALGYHDRSGQAAGENDGPHTHLEVFNSNGKEIDAYRYIMIKQPRLNWEFHPRLEPVIKDKRYPQEYNYQKKHNQIK